MRYYFKILGQKIAKSLYPNWADQLVDAWTYNADNMYGGKSLAYPAKKSFLVYRIVDLVSKNVASIPLEYYVGKRKIEGITPFTSIFEMPNNYQTRKDLIEETAAFFTLYGESFWWLSGIDDLSKLQIYVLDPRMMIAVTDTETDELIGWKYTAGNKQIPLSKDEVLQFKNTNVYNRYRGLSPLDALSVEIMTHYQASEWNKNFIENGTVFSNIIQVPDRMTKSEMKKMLNEINQVHAGSKKNYKNIIIKESMKINKASMTKLEMDFVESDKLTRDNILAGWSMPKSMLAYSEDLNRATADRYTANYWQNTVIPIPLEIQDKMNHLLLKLQLDRQVVRGSRIKFNFGDIEALWYNIDVKTKAAFDLMKMGSTREEAFSRFNLAVPTDDTMAKDQRFMSKLLVPYKEDGELQTQPASAPASPDEPVITDDFTQITQKLAEFRDLKSKEFKKRLELFFKKQQAKILRKIDKNTLDLEIVFNQEQKRAFDQFKDEILDIHENLNKILDFKYKLVEIDDNFVEKVTNASIKQIMAKDEVIKCLIDTDDQFQAVKDVYNKIDVKDLSKNFTEVIMNLLLLKYDDFQKDVEKKYYLEDK